MLEPLEAGGGGVPVIMGPVVGVGAGVGAAVGVAVGVGLGAGGVGVGATFEVAVTVDEPLA